MISTEGGGGARLDKSSVSLESCDPNLVYEGQDGSLCAGSARQFQFNEVCKDVRCSPINRDRVSRSVKGSLLTPIAT